MTQEVSIGARYKAKPNHPEDMPWASYVITITAIDNGDEEQQHSDSLITFTTDDGQHDTCRLNWLDGFWTEDDVIGWMVAEDGVTEMHRDPKEGEQAL